MGKTSLLLLVFVCFAKTFIASEHRIVLSEEAKLWMPKKYTPFKGIHDLTSVVWALDGNLEATPHNKEEHISHALQWINYLNQEDKTITKEYEKRIGVCVAEGALEYLFYYSREYSDPSFYFTLARPLFKFKSEE